MSGDMVTYRPLRNQVNRAAVRLEYEFYQKHIVAISDTGSHNW